LAASSIVTRLILVVVLAGPWMLALPSAMFGVNTQSFVGLAVLIGGFTGNSIRDRDFLRLPGASRRRVIAVRRSGQLTGDRTLDGIAINRVRRAARTTRSDRVLIPIAVAIYLAVPVVAAVRADAWWLWCLLPGAVAVAAIPVTWPPEDARVQRDRLLNPVGPPSAAASSAVCGA
jgi:hypothetical protein